jgi:hypothetical protein
VNYRFDNLEYGRIETRHVAAELVNYLCESEMAWMWQVRWPDGTWSDDDQDPKRALDDGAMYCPLLKEWGWKDVRRNYAVGDTIAANAGGQARESDERCPAPTGSASEKGKV